MKTGIHIIVRKFSLLMSIEATIAILLSYYACLWASELYHFPLAPIAGLWGALSASFILSSASKGLLENARIRLIGSFFGVLAPLISLYIFQGYNIYAFGLAIIFAVSLSSLCSAKDTFRTACITLSVVYVVGLITHPHIAPWLNCLTRLLESIIGGVITLIVAFCFYPLRKRFDLFQ